MTPTNKTKVTTQQATAEDRVLIKHYQVLRQSHDYQSAEVMYGVELSVANTPSSIQRGIDWAEEIVESRLITKADTHRKLLRKLPGSKT